jgi:hypothetical protein
MVKESMMLSRSTNPPMPTLHRLVFLLVALVVFAGAGLFFVPDLVTPRWPWSLTPFNTRFLGAVYLSELLAAVVAVVVSRWAPGRLILPQAVTFTAVVTLASLVHLDRFDPQRLVTWLWFVLYTVPLAILAYYLWRYRRLPPAEAAPPAPPWRAYLLGQAVVLGLYGIGLLVAPGLFSAFWPWPIDSFHGQVYSAVFLTGAVGSFVLARAAAPIEFLTQGLAQATLGTCAIAGLAIVDAAVHRVDWSAFGTWLWVGAFAVVLVAGLSMLWQAGTTVRQVAKER